MTVVHNDAVGKVVRIGFERVGLSAADAANKGVRRARLSRFHR